MSIPYPLTSVLLDWNFVNPKHDRCNVFRLIRSTGSTCAIRKLLGQVVIADSTQKTFRPLTAQFRASPAIRFSLIPPEPSPRIRGQFPEFRLARLSNASSGGENQSGSHFPAVPAVDSEKDQCPHSRFRSHSRAATPFLRGKRCLRAQHGTKGFHPLCVWHSRETAARPSCHGDREEIHQCQRDRRIVQGKRRISGQHRCRFFPEWP